LKVTSAGEISSDCATTKVSSGDGAKATNCRLAGQDVLAGFPTPISGGAAAVYDAMGRKMCLLPRFLTTGQTVVSTLRPLAPGVYYFELRYNGKVTTGKFLWKG
jgi:hypothetical protein